MPPAGFLLNKWPKRHAYVIEECQTLPVAAGLLDLPPSRLTPNLIWHPPSHPSLTLLSRMCGPCLRWWWQCPGCFRRTENLYAPPSADPNDWRCRRCHSLVYASQRFGFAHPLRTVLTPRKRATAIKKARRAAHRWDRLHNERLKPMSRPTPVVSPFDPELTARFSKQFAEQTRLGNQLVIEATLGAPKPAIPKIFWEPREKINIDSPEELQKTLHRLHELATSGASKRVRSQAQRMLTKHAKDLEGVEKRQAKRLLPKVVQQKITPAVRLTQAQIEAAQAIEAELDFEFD